MTAKDNQPEGPHKDGGSWTPKRGGVPPWQKPKGSPTGPLTEGEHTARITKIQGFDSKVYDGYTVVTEWVTDTGLADTLFINFENDEARQWVIEKNSDYVNTILEAGGMPGRMDPPWQDLTRALKYIWFSIKVKRAGKGRLYLAKLEVADEDESSSDSATEIGPSPATPSEPEEFSPGEPRPAHAPAQVAEEPKFTVEEIRERARANRKANRHLYDADAADDYTEPTSND